MSMNTLLIKKINKANGQNSVGLGWSARDKQAWGRGREGELGRGSAYELVRGRGWEGAFPSSFHLLKSVWHSITSSGCDPSPGMCWEFSVRVSGSACLLKIGSVWKEQRESSSELFFPHSLQHVSASAWKQLSQSIFFLSFYFLSLCKTHYSILGAPAQCSALRSRFCQESLELS